jgi:hypothetical protein
MNGKNRSANKFSTNEAHPPLCALCVSVVNLV